MNEITGQFLIQYADGKKDYITHDYFFSLDPYVKKQRLSPLRESYRQKDIDIFCSCTIPKPKMRLHYITDSDSYYVRAKLRTEHGENCFYKSEENDGKSPGSIYQRGFIKKPDGLIEIKLDGQDYRLEPKEKQTGKPKKDGVALVSKTASGISTHRPSIYATMWRLLTEAWNDTVKDSHVKGSVYPTEDVKVVYKRLIDKTVKAYAIKDRPLSELMYLGQATGRVHQIEDSKKVKTAAFTMLLLNNTSDVVVSDELCSLSLYSPTILQERDIDVPTSLYKKALKSVGGTTGPYFAGGFLKSTGYQKAPQFVSFALVPINSFGVPVESSHERRLYTELCKQRRPFLKCLSSRNALWNGFIPDGLLLDTKPNTIIEVFGMSESVVDYHVQREIKIEHFSQLKPAFNFWYWDAFKTSEIPIIPKKDS